MAQIGSTATTLLTDLLRCPTGLPSRIGELALRESLALASIADEQIISQNLAPEFAEKARALKYPIIHVYCERVVNTLKEKFRTFSGKAEMTIEIRVSHDHFEELETQLDLYVEAATDVLDRNRGDWGAGFFYTGGYEVIFGPVKRGGKNFLQIAKIRFEVNASKA